MARPKENVEDKVNLQDLTDFALTGMTDKQLAAALKVSVRTLGNFKKSPKFLAALKNGKAVADNKVEASLFKRACGYEVVETHWDAKKGKSVETEKHIPPDTVACIFWLKNRKPADWKDRVEHTGADGGPINFHSNIPVYPPPKTEEKKK
jgi:hypothetical protein